MGPLLVMASAHAAPQCSESRADAWLHPLGDTDFVARAAERGWLPAEARANPELLGVLLPALRADLALNERYAHRWAGAAPLPAPLLAMGGADDAMVPVRSGLAGRLGGADGFSARGPSVRWRALLPGGGPSVPACA